MDSPDEVDRIIAAWREQRPDLDTEPLGVFSRIGRLARHLDMARRSAFTSHQLDSWEFDVLAALRRAGYPYQMSPGALLTQTLVTSGTMTNRIDRLASRGLVVRRRSNQDRRGVLVELTVEGMSRVDAAITDLIDAEKAFLSALGPPERHQLTDLLRAVSHQFDD